ncbi:hypothetical protein [Tahibacter aquaticus]|nr:hypothetical protein [Tahibacter aquaticus]
MSFYTTGYWEMSNYATSRRELFRNGDWLKFTEIDPTHATLVVYDQNDLGDLNGLLAGHIFLELIGGELVGTDYGRELTFKPNEADPTRLLYAAKFANGTVHQPDEGGDGDPR